MKPTTAIYRYYNYPESDRIVPKRKTLWGAVRRYWPAFILIHLVCIVVCGIIGFEQLKIGEESSVVKWHDDFNNLWLSFELPLGNTLSAVESNTVTRVPVILTVAKILGAIFAFSALLTIAWRSFSPPIKRAWVNFIKYGPADYVVICGMGWKAYELAKDLREDPKYRRRKILIVDTDPDNPYVREFADDASVIFIQGDATRQHSLTAVGVTRANAVYVLSDDDELNCRITQQVNNLIDSEQLERKPIPCYVHIKDSRIRAYLEDNINCKCEKPRCNVMTFNVEENTVRRLLLRHPVVPVHQNSEEETYTHLVIVGDSSVAHALFLEQLRTFHMRKNHKVRLTWYLEAASDSVLTEKVSAIYKRWPLLDPNWKGDRSWLDAELKAFRDLLADTFANFVGPKEQNFQIEFRPIPTSESEMRSRSHSFYQSMKDNWDVHLYVCIDDGVRSSAVASMLEDSVNAWYGRDVRWSKRTKDRIRPISFGEYSDECMAVAISGEWIDPLAKRVHLSYSIKDTVGQDKWNQDCRDELIANLTDSGGLAKMLCDQWNRMREWQRESNRQCAIHLIVKLRMLGVAAAFDSTACSIMIEQSEIYRIQQELGLGEIEQVGNEVDLSYFSTSEIQNALLEEIADIEHRRWSAERLLQGWLPIFDETEWAENKNRCRDAWHLHHDLRPYEELDEAVKDYDRFIVANMVLYLGANRKEPKVT